MNFNKIKNKLKERMLILGLFSTTILIFLTMYSLFYFQLYELFTNATVFLLIILGILGLIAGIASVYAFICLNLRTLDKKANINLYKISKNLDEIIKYYFKRRKITFFLVFIIIVIIGILIINNFIENFNFIWLFIFAISTYICIGTILSIIDHLTKRSA